MPQSTELECIFFRTLTGLKPYLYPCYGRPEWLYLKAGGKKEKNLQSLNNILIPYCRDTKSCVSTVGESCSKYEK